MKVGIVGLTPNPIDTIGSAFAITRGFTYDEYLEKYSQKDALRLIRDCYEMGHMSGFEFVDIDFEIIGCSRVFEVEKVRSRLASYEVEAGAFTEARDFETVLPPEYRSHQYEYLVKQRIDTIKSWNEIDKKAGIEAKSRRYWTHQGLSRRMRSKQNFRALIETGWNRFCGKAQWEYREFMQKAKKELMQTELKPLCYLLTPKCLKNGFCNEKNSCGYYEQEC